MPSCQQAAEASGTAAFDVGSVRVKLQPQMDKATGSEVPTELFAAWGRLGHRKSTGYMGHFAPWATDLDTPSASASLRLDEFFRKLGLDSANMFWDLKNVIPRQQVHVS